jgi:predicted ester cyclase
MPATGKPVLLSGISIVRINNGKIVEGWDNWDQLGMLQQIGAYTRPDSLPLQKSA